MNFVKDLPENQPPQPLVVLPVRTLEELGFQRTELVRAVLSAREACEKTGTPTESEPGQAEEAQLLLSAAVQALEELDKQLAKVKRSYTEGSRYGA